jgi:hypothetical protein
MVAFWLYVASFKVIHLGSLRSYLSIKWNSLAVAAQDKDKRKMSEKLTREKVGDKLKQIYADIVAEPVPDRFVDLIEQLESGEDTNENSKKQSKSER